MSFHRSIPLALAMLTLMMAGLLLPATVPAGGPSDDALPWSVAADIRDGTAHPAVKFRAFNPQNLQWLDVDLDGQSEILSPNTNGRWYLFSAKGALRAELPWPSDGHPPGEGVQPSAVVGDLDGDGRREVYVVGNTGRLRAYEHDPALGGDGRIGMRFLWERCLDCDRGEHDGTPWGTRGRVFLQHDGTFHAWAIGADGSTRWHDTDHEGNAGPVLADLAGDGVPEVVFPTDGGAVVARRASDGAVVWWRDLRQATGADPGSVPAQPTATDVDGDGRKEVLVCARHAPSAADAHGIYALLGGDGKVRWSQKMARGNPMCNMHAVSLDFTKDGVRDALWLDWNTLGHHPGSFERLGPARMFLLDGRDGRVVWETAVDSRWSDDDLCVADADGDGANEILVPQQRGGDDGISVYTLQGKEEAWWKAPEGWTVARGVLCVNIGGKLHLVVSLGQPQVREGVQSPDGTSPTGRILVLDTKAPYKAGWAGQYKFSN